MAGILGKSGAEEGIVHVVLVAASPVDSSGEAVLAEDLIDLTAHRNGILVGVGGEEGTDQRLPVV